MNVNPQENSAASAAAQAAVEAPSSEEVQDNGREFQKPAPQAVGEKEREQSGLAVKLLRQGRNCSQAFPPCQPRINRNR